MLIFKIMGKNAWQAACRLGTYDGSADDRRDGFIHLSAREQVAATAAKHFAGRCDLVLIAFRADELGEQLKWEPSRGGALFPHFYGRLATDKALWIRELPIRDGEHILPALDEKG